MKASKRIVGLRGGCSILSFIDQLKKQFKLSSDELVALLIQK